MIQRNYKFSIKFLLSIMQWPKHTFQQFSILTYLQQPYHREKSSPHFPLCSNSEAYAETNSKSSDPSTRLHPLIIKFTVVLNLWIQQNLVNLCKYFSICNMQVFKKKFIKLCGCTVDPDLYFSHISITQLIFTKF